MRIVLLIVLLVSCEKPTEETIETKPLDPNKKCIGCDSLNVSINYNNLLL